MGKEQKSEYYDEIFECGEDFNLHYKDSFYWVQWTQVIKFLAKETESKILEIGCGTGQLAEYLKDEGFKNYKGFDFSEIAIKKAMARVKMYHFYQADALNIDSYPDDYAVIICLEVLEHVNNDLGILKNIKTGKKVIFSVPDFEAESHVRWFTNERQIKSRYYRSIDIKSIVRVGGIYICSGIRDDFKPSILQRITKSRESFSYESLQTRFLHYKNIIRSYFRK